MQFLCNSRPCPGVTRDQVLKYFRESEISDEAWELTKKGVISHWYYKLGEQPGVAFVVSAASADEVRAHLQESPVAKSGLLEFDIDPVSPFRHFE
jgi:hypothetical protein